MTSKEHPTATITTPNSTPGQSGRFGSERVAAFRRNQWPLSSECALGVSEQSYYRWRKEYGGLRTDQAKRLKDLEKENGRLRKAISDLTLDKLILKEALEGNC